MDGGSGRPNWLGGEGGYGEVFILYLGQAQEEAPQICSCSEYFQVLSKRSVCSSIRQTPQEHSVSKAAARQ